MGESADRDELGPGRGVGGHVLEGDAPRHLDGARVPRLAEGGHAPGHVVGSHVVEEEEVGPDGGRHLGLAEGVALHLHRSPRVEDPSLGHRRLDGDAGQVVVLDQDPVGQAGPVVEAPAGPHRRLLQGPQAGGGLAGVPDERPGGGGVGVAPGEGGDARQVAQEVEGRALGHQDGGQGTVHGGDGLAGRDPLAVVGPPVDLHQGIDLSDRLGRRPSSGEHAFGPRHQVGRHHRLGRQEGAGEVAESADVLGQGLGHRLPHRAHRRMHAGHSGTTTIRRWKRAETSG